MQPRGSINVNNSCWLNASMKLLGYDPYIRHWLQFILTKHTRCKHMCDNQCKSLFNIVKCILLYEQPCKYGYRVNWFAICGAECINIIGRIMPDGYYDPRSFVQNFLHRLLDFHLRSNGGATCPYGKDMTIFRRCVNASKCKNEFDSQTMKVGALHFVTPLKDFSLQHEYNQRLIWQQNDTEFEACKHKTSEGSVCGNVKLEEKYEYRTNNVVYVMLQQQHQIDLAQHQESHIRLPQIWRLQENGQTKYYKLHAILLKNRISAHHACLFQYGNNCYLINDSTIYKFCHPEVSECYNKATYGTTKIGVQHEWYPEFLCYHLVQILETQDHQRVFECLLDILHQRKQQVRQCKVLHHVRNQRIALLFNSVNYHKMNDYGSNKKSIKQQQHLLLNTNYKFKKNKPAFNDNTIQKRLDVLNVFTKKAGALGLNLHVNPQISWAYVIHKALGYPLECWTWFLKSTKYSGHVFVCKVYLNRAKNNVQSFVIGNNIYVQHHLNKKGTKHLRCGDRNGCGVTVTVNESTKEVIIHSSPHTHGASVSFASIAKPVLRQQLSNEFEQCTGKIRAMESTREKLNLLKQTLVKLQAVPHNWPVNDFPYLSSVSSSIHKIKQQFCENVENIQGIISFFQKQPNYIYANRNNNIVFCSLHALFRGLLADAKLEDGTFLKIKFTNNVIGFKQVYIIASWNLDSSKTYNITTPCIFGLLTDKHEETYKWLFETINFWYDSIGLKHKWISIPVKSDYESAPRKILQSHGTNTENDSFHWAQCVLRNLVKHNLAKYVRKGTHRNDEFIPNKEYDPYLKRLIEYVYELEKLPCLLVEIVFVAIANKMQQWACENESIQLSDVNAFIAYMKTNWIKLSIFEQTSPKHTYGEWLLKCIFSSSNNPLEGLNRYFNALLNKYCTCEDFLRFCVVQENIYQQQWKAAIMDNELSAMRKRNNNLITKCILMSELRDVLQPIADKQQKMILQRKEINMYLTPDELKQINNVLHQMSNISRIHRINKFKRGPLKTNLKTIDHKSVPFLNLFDNKIQSNLFMEIREEFDDICNDFPFEEENDEHNYGEY